MKRCLYSLLLCAFSLLLPAAVHAAAPDAEETKALAAVGFDLIPEGVIKQGFRWTKDKRVEVPVVVAYRLNGQESVFKDDQNRWHRSRNGRKDDILVSRQDYDNFAAMYKAVAFAPFPTTPEGITLREVAQFKAMPTRMIPDDQGHLIVLCRNGDVWKVNPADATKTLWFKEDDYVRPQTGDLSALGITFDQEGRLYVVTNQMDRDSTPFANVVTIFRTEPGAAKESSPLKPWLRAAYPWGVSAFTHGAGHIAQGPDGFLYVNSGSRTNQGEAGDGGKYSTEGEVPLTSCIWRLDPKSDRPDIEIYARGLRNAYGFCWDDKGRMFATDNGPEKDAPEELNIITAGGHYGFPYEFSDLGGAPDQPKKPDGLATTLPVKNIGPDAGGSLKKPLSTFDPHSSPAGIIYLDSRYPKEYQGSFFVVRFGSFKPPKWRTGLDLLCIRLDESDPGQPKATVHTLASPFGRPLDICQTKDGVLYICESLRETVIEQSNPTAPPGRVLELRFAK